MDDRFRTCELKLQAQRRFIMTSLVFFFVTPPALYIISPKDFQLPRNTLLVCLVVYIGFGLFFHTALVRKYKKIAREGEELTTGQTSRGSPENGSLRHEEKM